MPVDARPGTLVCHHTRPGADGSRSGRVRNQTDGHSPAVLSTPGALTAHVHEAASRSVGEKGRKRGLAPSQPRQTPARGLLARCRGALAWCRPENQRPEVRRGESQFTVAGKIGPPPLLAWFANDPPRLVAHRRREKRKIAPLEWRAPSTELPHPPLRPCRVRLRREPVQRPSKKPWCSPNQSCDLFHGEHRALGGQPSMSRRRGVAPEPAGARALLALDGSRNGHGGRHTEVNKNEGRNRGCSCGRG
jgi:hypothetical protein